MFGFTFWCILYVMNGHQGFVEEQIVRADCLTAPPFLVTCFIS